jgi:hypothetical protein
MYKSTYLTTYIPNCILKYNKTMTGGEGFYMRKPPSYIFNYMMR